MSHKLSLSTAALCAALLAIPLLPPPSDTTSAKRQKQPHHPTQDPPRISVRDSTVFTPVFGNASEQGSGPAALRRAQ
jgi:hypothetical protein